MLTRDELAETLLKIGETLERAPSHCEDESDFVDMEYALDGACALIPDREALFGPEYHVRTWDDVKEYNDWVRKIQAVIDSGGA